MAKDHGGPGPRFTAGERVRVGSVDPAHHTRVPRYVRGQPGEVVELAGHWPLADDRARGRDTPAQPVYAVRFAAVDLWGSGTHQVTVDLWESSLRPAEPETGSTS